MTNIDAYIEELNAEVELRRSDYPLPVMAFTSYVMDEIAEKTNVNEHFVVHCDVKDRGNKVQGEIHGYGISENGEVLTLYYSDYAQDQEIMEKPSLLKEDFKNATNRMQGFYNKAIRGLHMDVEENTDVYEVAKYIYDNQKDIMSVRLCFLSNRPINEYDLDKIRINGKSVYSDIWDIKKIYANLHSGIDRVEINLDFENEYHNFQLPYIEMNSRTYEYKCISTMFPAKLLRDLYDKHNTDLLAGNVRYFLKYKGQRTSNANIGIRETLEKENEMFLAYNNGITAIASDIETVPFGNETQVDKDTADVRNDYISTGIIKKLVDFRIVNGGQTTACIYDTKQKNKNINLLGVYVMVKILVVKNTKNDLVQNIIKYTNSQSKIKASDFSSSNKFNVAFEDLSRNIVVPNKDNKALYWFYERITGQYDQEKGKLNTKLEKSYFESCHPKQMKFNKEDLAKVWKSWELKPHDAVKGATTTYLIFMEEQEKRGFLPDESFYKNTISLLILYRFLLSRPEAKTYGSGKAPVAAYALAYLSMFSNGRLDLNKIWENQDISDDMRTFLNKLSERIWERLNFHAESASKTVLSISKRQDIFDSIKNYDFGLKTDIIKSDLK